MGGINPMIPLMGQAPQVNDPLQEYQKAEQIKSLIGQQALQQQQVQANQTAQQSADIQLKQQQQNDADMQALRNAFPNYVSKSVNGVGQVDYNGLATDLATKGVNPALIQKLQMDHLNLVEAQSKVGKEQQDLSLSQNKQMYETLEGLRNITDPDQRLQAAPEALNKLKIAGIDVSGITPQSLQDDKVLDAHEAAIGAHGQVLTDAKTLADTRDQAAKATKDTADAVVAQQEAALTPEQRAQLKAQGTVDGAELMSFMQNPPKGYKATPVDFLRYQKSISPVLTMNLQQSLLTPEAKAALGEQYAQTGQLPQGMRSPAMAAQIMNAGVGANPGVNLAAAKAGYHADAASLANVQKTFDNVNAFENTAGKNLDIFLHEAKKVTDTGLPIANLPARYIASKLGGTEQAAFDAARTTALTEIAKVLSSANAGSGVLSDGARNEVEGLIKPDATLDQIISAANILKKDMTSRHGAYADEINQIQSRIGGKPAAEATPAAPKAGNIRARDPQGKLHEAPAGTALPSGWTLEK